MLRKHRVYYATCILNMQSLGEPSGVEFQKAKQEMSEMPESSD